LETGALNKESDRLHWEKNIRIKGASTGRGKSNLGLDRRKQGSKLDMWNTMLVIF